MGDEAETGSFSMKRNRWIYAAFTILIIGLGLGARAFSSVLPDALNTYRGLSVGCHDLYGLRVSISENENDDDWPYQPFLLFFIEISQLYHAEWIDRIRDTSLGGLVLGYGFLWSDIEAYTLGVASCAAIELLALGIKKRRCM